MAGITLERAETMLGIWLEAEVAISTGQSYSINGNTMTRANLSEVRKSIEYWEGKVKSLSKLTRKRQVFGVVPRDL